MVNSVRSYLSICLFVVKTDTLRSLYVIPFVNIGLQLDTVTVALFYVHRCMDEIQQINIEVLLIPVTRL